MCRPISARSFTRSELATRPILDLLERSGVKVERATQRIGAGLATPAVAQALGIETGSPLIELTRVVFDRSGRGVEHLHACIAPTATTSRSIWSGPGARRAATGGPRRHPIASRFEHHPSIDSKREITMTNDKSRFSRRHFLQTSALFAAAASGTVAMPSVLRAQGAGVKLGILQPVTGALSYSGQQGKLGAQLAIDEINAAGGIKGLGKIEVVFGDAQSTPDGGTAEVEKMNAAGVVAVVGGYASSICLAASQAAARYNLPYLVDVGVADNIVTRGLKNTFRFGPGFGVIAKTAIENLTVLNDAAGKPAKTVMIVNEDSLFGSGLAKLLNEQLPQRGFQVLETIPHPTPTRDFNNVALKIKSQNPDLIIPADYYNEYVLLARTLQQQKIRPKGIYSILGGAASSYKFVKEFPDAAQYIMDCNHSFDPKNPKALALKKKVEDAGAVLHL